MTDNNKQKSKSELIDAIREELGFFYIESGNEYVLEVMVDKLNPHTAVAFSSYIVLNDKPKVIRYEIASKNSKTIISNKLIIDE